FIVVAAHELRTPLTSLRLAAESLDVQGNEDPSRLHRAARRLSTVVEQSHKLDGLIDELLDLSRIHAGHFDVAPQGVDLRTVVSAVAGRLDHEARKAGCALAVETGDPGLGLWAPRRIDQAVTNLLTNAIKFGRGKPVEIAVRRTDHHAEISVSD